jgi:endonuclease/exonuclease/phosphatase family metal-dependent hydrolase
VVPFHIAFAREVERAIDVLREPGVREADVLLLQEMDSAATDRIATTLGFGYVYYPAIHRTRGEHDFGNAVLSRWPIVDDAKVILPHPSRYAGTQRIATAATLRIDTTLIRVYSTHLGTPMDVSGGRRDDQLRAIIADAVAFPFAIIAGDMNTADIGVVATKAGWRWTTREGPHTTTFGRWDHIFVKGLDAPSINATGTVMDVHGASDHRPVWSLVLLPHG